MSFRVQREGPRVQLSGTVEHASAVAAREALVRALDGLSGEVVLELSGLESASSVSISVLLRVMAEADRRKLELRLESMPRRLFEMARVSGLDSILPIESLSG
ncbi:MAG: anti-sigma factor antagonist [Gammaproteobacteria bacterium]|nr:MAG: anti-sigma factor antagonist [Gammaproteobacteria bacterium]